MGWSRVIVNVDFILNKVRLYLKNTNELIEDKFDNLFKGLEDFEYEEVKKILKEAGIILVPTKNINYDDYIKNLELNESKILGAVKPFLNHCNEILDKDFNSLFGHLNHKQCYSISDFLFSQGISIIYNDTDQKEINETESEVSQYIDDENILELVKPYLKNNSISESQFNTLFKKFELRDRYKISDILMDQNIYIDYENENLEVDPDLREKGNTIIKEYEVSAIEFEHPVEITSEGIYDLKYSNNEQLCLMYNRGNQLALHLLISNNQRLVHKRVSKYRKTYNHKLDIDDLIAFGNEGIIEAAKRFNQSMDTKFSTYATWWIDQKICRGIMDTGFTVRIPVHRFQEINKILKIQRLNQFDDEYELMEKIMLYEGFSIEKVKELFRLKDYCYSIISLNAPVGEEYNNELVELIEDTTIPSIEDQIFDAMLKKELDDLLETLTDREERVIRLKYGLDDGNAKTLEYMGKEFGVTRERIRVIEAKALRKLRHQSRSDRIKEFLEI